MNASQIIDMAIELQTASNFHELSTEESWKMADHMTPMQIQQFRASNELFALHHLMEESATILNSKVS